MVTGESTLKDEVVTLQLGSGVRGDSFFIVLLLEGRGEGVSVCRILEEGFGVLSLVLLTLVAFIGNRVVV